MKTIFYIDGFNFYYGVCRNRPDGLKHRWLDIAELCRRLMSDADIAEIKYFTARAPSPVGTPRTQAAYLDALRTLPKVTIIEGKYLTSNRRMPLADDPTQTVRVVKHEEKGTDVNIACHMLIDAFRQHCERLAVISNDSDLVYPIRFVREMGLSVYVFNPQIRPSHDLTKAATKTQNIFTDTIARCMLSDPITTADGATIRKPVNW